MKIYTDNIINFGKEAVLYTKGQKTALFDSGMAHKPLVSEIQQILGDAPLDYLFLTHSHYDHVGGTPYIKQAWPNCQVMGSAYAQYIFTRPGALATIRKYSEQAAALDGIVLPDYSDSMMSIDTVLTDGEVIDLEGAKVQAIALPGHTKCSMGYLIDDTILLVSETTGYLNEHNQVIPSYLVSGIDALHAVEKCRKLAPELLIPPHRMPVTASDHPQFWDQCLDAIREAQSIILDGHRAGRSEDDLVAQFKKMYWQGEIRLSQPEFAFVANTKAMIHSTLAEARQII